MVLRVVAALLSGVMVSAAFEPVGWSWFAPWGLAALALTVHGTRARGAATIGFGFGVGFFFVLQYWMRAVGTDAWLGLSLLQALFMVPLALAWNRLQRSTRWWPWWCALTWVAVETLRSSWPFGGMPWGRLSYAAADSLWAHPLPVLGFTGVSLLMALSGTSLAYLWLHGREQATSRSAHARRLLSDPRPALVPLGVTAALLALGAGATSALSATAVPSGSATVAVVQGDVPGEGNDLISVHREVTRNQVAATLELAEGYEERGLPRLDLALWPENSTAVDPFRDQETRTGITAAVQALDSPLLVGAMVDGEREDQVLNQGIVWDPQTGAGDRFTKWHPVPFGEYIPWRDRIFKENLGRLRQIGRDMLAGERATPLRVGDLLVGNAICFDVAYDDVLQTQIRAGAELLTVQTSNAMFIHTPQIDQQYEITRLRARESARPLAVAATNGVSGVIDAEGETVSRVSVRTTGSTVAELSTYSTVTPAVRVGPWPGRLAVLLTVLVLLLGTRGPRVTYVHPRSSSLDV